MPKERKFGELEGRMVVEKAWVICGWSRERVGGLRGGREGINDGKTKLWKVEGLLCGGTTGSREGWR